MILYLTLQEGQKFKIPDNFELTDKTGQKIWAT